MTIDLKKDLCFFDLETTGLNVIRDRIIQIAIVKIDRKDHSRSEYYKMINPGPVFISEEAASVHGITNEMVKNKPTFIQLAKEILDFIGDSDLVGYNSNRFDVPLLMEEFARAGFDFDMEKEAHRGCSTDILQDGTPHLEGCISILLWQRNEGCT
jgi:DNA polymerase-3 subunit epsilon